MPLALMIVAIIASATVIVSIAAWGIVQILDIQEALHLRRLEKERMIQKAREYLTNPTGQTSSSGTTTYTSTGSAYNPHYPQQIK